MKGERKAMPSVFPAILAIAMTFLASSGAGAEGPVLALKDVRILSISQGGLTVIPRGAVFIKDGKIAAAGESIPVPAGAQVLDLPGRWVLPGFIDAHSQLGIRGESDEATSAITEDLRILDAYDPWDPEIERCLERGVTAVALSPGERNAIGGAISVIKLVPGRVPIPVVRERAALKASISRSIVGSPSNPRYPTALSSAVELFGSWVKGDTGLPFAFEGRRIGKDGGAPIPATGHPEKLPLLLRIENRSLAEEALSLLEGSGRVAVLLPGRALDSRALSLLAPRCPVVIGPLDLSDPARLLEGPACLERSGTPLAFCGCGERRDILTTAVLAMRSGLSRSGALAALTEGAARIYGLEGRIGRIGDGADGDIAVWSGDPFSLSARVELALVDGEIVYRAPPSPSKEVAP